MKKILTKAALLLILPLVAVSFTSCSNDDDSATPVITPQAEQLSFTSGAYAKELPLGMSDVSEWSVDVAYSGGQTGWVTASKSASAVAVAVVKNTGAARQATLLISAPGMVTVSVPVSQKAQFSSELIGSYVPDGTITDGELVDPGVRLVTEWNEKGAPALKFGDGELPWALIEGMLPQLVGIYYLHGLVGLDLLDDGRISAKYHDVTVGDGIAGLLDPKFGTELLTFPDPVKMPAVPVDVVTYYTQDGKVYLAVDKSFIAQVDPGTLGVPVCTFIDGLIAKYSLPVVSDKSLYALPLKYTLAGTKLSLYVDRGMMLPFKGLLTDLIGMLVPVVDEDGDGQPDAGTMDPAAIQQFVSDIFDNSTKFELGINLKTQAE